MKRAALTRLQFALSMAIFGTLSLFVRRVPLPSGELALLRALLACALVGVYLLITKTNPVKGLNRRSLLLLLLSGGAMGFNWIALFEAYRHTTVSVATLAYYFAPTLLTLGSFLLWRERMTRRQLLCFVLSTLGVVLIVGVTGAGGGNHALGVALGLLAAMLYATVMLLNKHLGEIAGITRTFWQFAAAILVLLPYVLARGGFHLDLLDGTGWGFLLTVGLVHTGLTYCLYFSSLARLRGAEAALLSYVDPLVAVILSVTMMSEPISLPQIVGGVLVLGSSIANELSPKKNA